MEGSIGPKSASCHSAERVVRYFTAQAQAPNSAFYHRAERVVPLFPLHAAQDLTDSRFNERILGGTHKKSSDKENLPKAQIQKTSYHNLEIRMAAGYTCHN